MPFRAGNVWGRNGVTTEMRFREKVAEIGNVCECWEWRGAKAANGYGLFRTDGRLTGAHRFALRSLVGELSAVKQVDHLCGNRGCVNPHHLEAVTQRENLRRSRAQ